ISAFSLPSSLYCAISRIVWILSSLASWMKQQVLMTITSASCSSSVIWYHSFARSPSMTSESTRFLSQPRDINNTFMLPPKAGFKEGQIPAGICPVSTCFPAVFFLIFILLLSPVPLRPHLHGQLQESYPALPLR